MGEGGKRAHGGNNHRKCDQQIIPGNRQNNLPNTEFLHTTK
jgi:hypothetical protein